MDFNPILTEIQSHMQSMSPGAQAVVSKMAAPPVDPGMSTPSVIHPGMLLPHPDAAPASPTMAMGSPTPTLGMPMQPNVTSGPAARGTIAGDTSERGRLLGSTPGVDQIANRIEGTGFGQAHPTMGRLLGDTAQVAGKIGDTALNVGSSLGIPAINTLARDIPGTTQHHEQLLGRANTALGQDIGNAQKEAQTANETATAGKTNAETPLVLPEAEARIGLQNAQASGVPSEITEREAQTYNLQHPQDANPDIATYRSLVKLGMSPSAALQEIEKDKAMALKPATIAPEQQYLTEYATRHPGSTIAQAERQYMLDTQRPMQTAPVQVFVPGQTPGTQTLQSVRPGQSVSGNAITPGGLNSENVAKVKPTADEQRRADLAENLRENFGQLRDIISRRPELFGPLSGRWAEMKQKFGTDDPDLAALQTIEHQVGMAQISAHGMRSAQGVQQAADSIMNHLHSGPHGLLSSLDAAEHSVGTFTGDVENKGQTAPRTGGTAGDPLGIR